MVERSREDDERARAGGAAAAARRKREQDEEDDRDRERRHQSSAWSTIKDIFNFDFGGFFGTIFSGLLWVGVLTGIYFIARSEKGQELLSGIFGPEKVSEFFAGADQMIAGLLEKVGIRMDVTKKLEDMDDPSFKQTVGGKNNENMSPEMVDVLAKHRHTLLPIAREANGGTATQSELINDKTIFALLRNKPEVIGEIAAAMKPGASKGGELGKKIIASIKTIINDTTVVEDGKDRLTILLSEPHLNSTIALLEQLAPDDHIRKPIRPTIATLRGTGNVSADLRTVLSMGLDAMSSTSTAQAPGTPPAGGGTGRAGRQQETAAPLSSLFDKVMPVRNGVREFSMAAAVQELMVREQRDALRPKTNIIATLAKQSGLPSTAFVTQRNLDTLLNFADSIDTAAGSDTAAHGRALKVMNSLAGTMSGTGNGKLLDGLSPAEISAFFSNKANSEAVAALLNGIDITTLPAKQKEQVETLRKNYGSLSGGGLAPVLADQDAVEKLQRRVNDMQAQSCNAPAKTDLRDDIKNFGRDLLDYASSQVIRENASQLSAAASVLARSNCTPDGTIAGPMPSLPPGVSAAAIRTL